MSSVCPNCGSAQIEPIGPHPVYTCGSVFRVDLGRLDTDPPCALIRSLREELAAARDAERDRIERLEEALDQSVHALRWLHYHGMTSEFENKRKAAYDLARPLLEARGIEATNE